MKKAGKNFQNQLFWTLKTNQKLAATQGALIQEKQLNL